MAEQDAITIQIDPNAKLQERYLGTDEDGPRYGPMSLYECIISAAVERLVGYGEKVVREKVGDLFNEQIQVELETRLPALIDEAFTESMTVKDGVFGPEKTKTFRDLLVEHARTQLQSKKGSYGSETVFDKVVKEQVDYSLREILSGEVAEAKARIQKRLQEKAAEMLAADSAKAAGVRL